MSRPQPLGRRVAVLVALVCAGVVVGIAGRAITGDDAWALAIPVVLAAGWLVIADPTRCAPPPDNRRGPGR